MTGNLEDAYEARETPMVFYLNVHTALEQMRKSAEDSDSSGPRVRLAKHSDQMPSKEFSRDMIVHFSGDGCWA